jgi:hypothetical protein
MGERPLVVAPPSRVAGRHDSSRPSALRTLFPSSVCTGGRAPGSSFLLPTTNGSQGLFRQRASLSPSPSPSPFSYRATALAPSSIFHARACASSRIPGIFKCCFAGASIWPFASSLAPSPPPIAPAIALHPSSVAKLPHHPPRS